jgi:copper chaperone NosL
MNRWFHKIFLCLIPVALLVAGCDRQTALVPPKIQYGLETCADCGMIINDPHYAAALAWRATPDAPAQIAMFDDIGCLLAWRNHHPGVQVAAMWVKDVRTAAWLAAPSARYLKSRQLSTPMGWGIVAGATKNDFSELAERDPVLTWSELLNLGEPKAGSSVSANIEQTKN